MKQTPIIVHIRCEDYKRLGILIGAIGDAGDEGVQILSHEHEDEVIKHKRHRGNDSWTKAVEYYAEVAAYMNPGKDYSIETLSKTIKINNKYKNKGAQLTSATIQTLIRKMVKEGSLVSSAKDIVRLA